MNGIATVLCFLSLSAAAQDRDFIGEISKNVSRPTIAVPELRGVGAAQSDIVAFVDDDVILEPAWLRNLTAQEIGAEIARLPEVRGVERPKLPAVSQEATRPFEHPYYWSAFILIGDPN